MKKALVLLFLGVLVSMLYVTITASLDENIVTAGARLWSDAWFRATLADAYFGFLTFFVWVCWKETGPWKRALWFLAIMALGNIAMSVYVLRELWRMNPGESLSVLLTRRNT